MLKNVIFLLVLIILSIIICIQQYNYKKINDDNFIYKQNTLALADTVRVVKNKAGELQSEKYILIADKNNILDVNTKLVKELKKQKDEVIFISTVNANLQSIIKNISIVDTFNIKSNIDTTFNIKWNFNEKYDDNNYRAIEGVSSVNIINNKLIFNNKLTKFNIGINLVSGIKDDNEKLSVFIKTDYPDFNFSKIDGALIDPSKSEILKKMMKQPRFIFGLMLGTGVSYTGEIKPSIFIGAGLTYRIFSF